MRVGVLFSGGKDSTYTVWLLQHQSWEIPVLVTIEPNDPESMMFHYPTVEWTRLQARAMRIEHISVKVPSGLDDGLEEVERTLATLRKKDGLEGIATGAVASDYQKARFDRISEQAGLKSFSPLWRKKPGSIVADLIQADFKIVLTAVAAKGLDQSWLGKTLDEDSWESLRHIAARHGIHLTGEGGEYESFVTDGPNFHETIRIERTRQAWDGESGRLTIKSASLMDKT